MSTRPARPAPIPVLVTPLSRRQFKDGKLVDDLVPWADAVRAVAAETGTPLVDLNARSAAAAQAMGALKAGDWAEAPPSPAVAKAIAGGTTVGVKFYEPPIPGAAPVPMDPPSPAGRPRRRRPAGSSRQTCSTTPTWAPSARVSSRPW
jgi:hypothetical protein